MESCLEVISCWLNTSGGRELITQRKQSQEMLKLPKKKNQRIEFLAKFCTVLDHSNCQKCLPENICTLKASFVSAFCSQHMMFNCLPHGCLKYLKIHRVEQATIGETRVWRLPHFKTPPQERSSLSNRGSANPQVTIQGSCSSASSHQESLTFHLTNTPGAREQRCLRK